MKWREFKALLTGLNGSTPLGNIVSIRSETDPETIKKFSPDQKRIRNEWRIRQISKLSDDEKKKAVRDIHIAVAGMCGVEINETY